MLLLAVYKRIKTTKSVISFSKHKSFENEMSLKIYLAKKEKLKNKKYFKIKLKQEIELYWKYISIYTQQTPLSLWQRIYLCVCRKCLNVFVIYLQNIYLTHICIIYSNVFWSVFKKSVCVFMWHLLKIKLAPVIKTKSNKNINKI